MQQTRLNRLARALECAEFSGIALNAGPSLTYFTGLNFHLMERPVVFLFIPGKDPVFILPKLEAPKVQGEKGVIAFYYDENPKEWGRIFAKALDTLNVSSAALGVEPLQLRLFEYNLLQSASSVNLIDGSSEIARVRSRKDESEVQLLQNAVDIAQDALRSTLPLIKLGMTEKDLANELVLQLFRHGSEPALPFSPIVSTGPSGANPHAKPSMRKLEVGDLLVIDWGASHEGYVSDITRTFAVGEINDESRNIHDLVQQANAAGRAAGVVGARCSDVDKAARTVISDAGYGQFFTHRTGHGIGRQCHEEPFIHGDNDETLKPGMTYTVEPGIYLPGKNGVRIEDDILVTEDGPISLSNLPRRIIRVG